MSKGFSATVAARSMHIPRVRPIGGKVYHLATSEHSGSERIAVTVLYYVAGCRTGWKAECRKASYTGRCLEPNPTWILRKYDVCNRLSCANLKIRTAHFSTEWNFSQVWWSNLLLQLSRNIPQNHLKYLISNAKLTKCVQLQVDNTSFSNSRIQHRNSFYIP